MPVPANAPPGPGRTLQLRDLFPPAERTVPKMLLRQAERYGQRRLVTIGGATLSYAETCAAAAGHAATLAAAGIGPGDRVAVMCGNRIEILFTIFGLRLARRHRRSHQHGFARSPARAHSQQLRRAAHRHRARPDLRADVARPLARSARDGLARWRQRRAQLAGLQLCRVPAACSGHDATSGRARRYVRHPLHLRHDRPFKGCLLSACPIFLVGRLYIGTSRAPRDRRAADHVAYVPYQRFGHLFPDAPERCNPRRGTAFFGVRLYPGAGAGKRNRHLRARRHGADAAGAATDRRRPHA